MNCLLYQKQCSMSARRWTEQYNAKRESMKDYKYFFYQYSEFHVFTRQSSVENCYQRTNYNIMVSNKNDVNPGGHPGPVTHVGQSHPTITFNGGHPLNVFAKQPILNSILNTLEPYTMFVVPFSGIWQSLWHPEPFHAEPFYALS